MTADGRHATLEVHHKLFGTDGVSLHDLYESLIGRAGWSRQPRLRRL